jgi:hypothetical protein
MKLEEKIVNEYLLDEGYKDIVFEPDGNIPPDFLVNSRIAIEVRRLNKHDNNGDGLEILENSTFDKLKKIVNSIKNDSIKQSAYVQLEFSRPFVFDKNIAKIIRSILQNHIDKIEKAKKEYFISDNVKLTINPATKKDERIYLPCPPIDYDATGFVIADIIENIVNKIVPEKTKKIEKNKDKYKYWWLILVNFIGGGLIFDDEKHMLKDILKTNIWNKIIIINKNKPYNPNNIL